MTDAPDDVEEGPVLTALPTVLPTDGCAWDAVYADCGGECEAYAQYEDPAAAQALWEAVASDLLWHWTGQVFGVCEVSVRPCRTDCGQYENWSTYWGRGPRWDPTFPGHGGPGVPFYPVLIAGTWHNVTCGCVGICRCDPTGPTVLTLPGPVQSVVEVWIDGTVLDPANYRLANKRHLIRTDGEVWPACQDLTGDPLTDDNTFEVIYTRGIPVPIGGQIAVGRLACELALGACGSDECALPDSLTSLTRQGVAMNFQDPTQSPDAIVTGIRSIDWWVQSVSQPATFASIRSYDSR